MISSSRVRHGPRPMGARFARARRGRQSQVGTMAPPRSEPTRSVRLIGVLTGAGDVAGTAARFRSQANTPRSPRAAPARVLRELSILCIAFFVLSIRCARDGGCFLSSRPARLSDHKIPACWASSATSGGKRRGRRTAPRGAILRSRRLIPAAWRRRARADCSGARVLSVTDKLARARG